MNLKTYCINLSDRSTKWSDALTMWSAINFSVTRFEAIDCRPNGMAGAFKSHLSLLEYHFANFPNDLILVTEDDCRISKDFDSRLELFYKQLPADWDIFMLGHWPMINHKYTKVLNSVNICQARLGFLGAHCYLVNPKSLNKIINVFKNLSVQDMDRIFNVFANKYKTYIAMPAMAYQFGNYSDTSNSSVDYTGTKTFYSDNYLTQNIQP